MATTFNANSGIHQLPANCYPPSDSDDEDSFVVLNNSLGPDVHTDRAYLNTEPISTQTIQASLDSIADILAQQSLQTSQNKETGGQSVLGSSHCNFQSTDFSPDEIQKKVDNLIGENLKLKETLAQNNIAMKKQVDTITQWQAEVQRVQESHKEKFVEMKKYIAILKAENEQLKKLEERSMQEDTKKTKDIVAKQSDNIMQFELEAAQKRVKELEKALDILSLERESLGKQMSIKEQELNNVTSDKDLMAYELDLLRQKEKKQTFITSEIQALNDELVELRDANNKFRLQVSSLQNENDKLKLDISDKEEKLSDANRSCVSIEQDLSQVKQQLMASQMHITELKEFNVRGISEKDKEIESLAAQMKNLQVNEDENTALRTQLDLYKNDFETEQQQRQALFNEKNKIADDLQQLQRRNNQLREENDQLRAGFVPVRREDTRSAAAAAASDSPPPLRHFCPLCSSKFTSLHLLEDHIEYCLANRDT